MLHGLSTAHGISLMPSRRILSYTYFLSSLTPTEACKIHEQIPEQPRVYTTQDSSGLQASLVASPALGLACLGQGTQTSVSLGLSNVYSVLASTGAERQVVSKCLVTRAGALG